MNFGPGLPEFDIIPEYVENYQVIVDAGYLNSNTASDTPVCTFCPNENLLNSETEDNMLDHVFVRNADVSDPQIKLRDTLTLETDEGTERELNFSDHFAFQASLSWKVDY